MLFCIGNEGGGGTFSRVINLQVGGGELSDKLARDVSENHTLAMPFPFCFGFKITIVGTPLTSTPKACISCPAIA
jgi:hypothetical protein